MIFTYLFWGFQKYMCPVKCIIMLFKTLFESVRIFNHCILLGYQLNINDLSLHEPLKCFRVSQQIFVGTLTIFVLCEADNKAPCGIP